MTIPDDTSDFPRWLEQRLMSPDFRGFVAELSAYFPASPAIAPPSQLFDRWLKVALVEGLNPIPPEVLNLLLKYPTVLVAFQERIVKDGGAYWDGVLNRSDDLSETFNRGKRSLDGIFSADTPRTTRKPISKTPPQTNPKPVAKSTPSTVVKRTGRRGYKAWAFISTGIAACLAVAVGYFVLEQVEEKPVPKSQIAWGWGKPSGLASNESIPKDYLNKLADNAEEWSQHQPSDAAGVGTRIAELRMGCTRLMHSAYGPLNPADKAWLLEHCREWAKQMDKHQQALDAGGDPKTVRAEVELTVRGIATTLRQKAKELG